MDNQSTKSTSPAQASSPSAPATLPPFTRAWHGVRDRILSGLLVILPIVITVWVVYWLYATLERYIIDPLALLVLWKIRGHEQDAELPRWFEVYVAPVIAIVIALLILYCLGFLVRSRLRRAIDWILLRVPIISVIYNGVSNVFQSLENKRGQQRPQRAVLIPFPHPGMRMAAFVTGTCRDEQTQKVVLCVYVPQSPMLTNGHLIFIPEEEVTDLNWTAEQTVQTLLSGGFTAPEEVRYFSNSSSS